MPYQDSDVSFPTVHDDRGDTHRDVFFQDFVETFNFASTKDLWKPMGIFGGGGAKREKQRQEKGGEKLVHGCGTDDEIVEANIYEVVGR